MKVNKITKSFTTQVVKAVQPKLKDEYKSFSASKLIGISAIRLKRKLDDDENRQWMIALEPFYFPLGIVQSMKDVNESVIEWEIENEDLIVSLYEQILSRLGMSTLIIEYHDALLSSHRRVKFSFDSFILGLFLVQIIEVLGIRTDDDFIHYNQIWNDSIPAHLDKEVLSARLCLVAQGEWPDTNTYVVKPTDIRITASKIKIDSAGTSMGQKVPELPSNQSRERFRKACEEKR